VRGATTVARENVMSFMPALVEIVKRVDLVAWLPPQLLAAPAAVKAIVSAVILVVPGLLTLFVAYLVVRRLLVQRGAGRPLAVAPAAQSRYQPPLPPPTSR
jgi:hypothetical protein